VALAWKDEGNSTSGLKACDVRADSFDCASAIRTWNDAVFYPKWIFSFGNDEVTVIQRYGMDCCALAMDDDQQGRVNIPLTRTSLSPICGTGAFSFNLSASKPVFPSTVHCFAVVGAIPRSLKV
jgi:hypothetical protein